MQKISDQNKINIRIRRPKCESYAIINPKSSRIFIHVQRKIGVQSKRWGIPYPKTGKRGNRHSAGIFGRMDYVLKRLEVK